MSRCSYLLKIIITALLLLAGTIINYQTERTIIYILSIYIIIISIIDINFKSLPFGILTLLLLIYFPLAPKINILIKIIYAISVILLLIYSISEKNRYIIKNNFLYNYKKKLRKKMFCKELLPKVREYNEEMYKKTYSEQRSINDRVKKDLEEVYMYGKSKFYGFKRRRALFPLSFKNYDFIFAIVSIIYFSILYFFWR